jgi:hypothetical protein
MPDKKKSRVPGSQAQKAATAAGLALLLGALPAQVRLASREAQPIIPPAMVGKLKRKGK